MMSLFLFHDLNHRYYDLCLLRDIANGPDIRCWLY